MATPSMQSGRVVGTVKGVDGVVTAINERGVIRTLKPGDKVYAGETIQTADGANAHIDFSRGGFATLGAGQSLPMDGVVLSQAAEASKPQAGQTQAPGTTDADIEKLQQQIEEAIAKGEDPTQLLEAAAAGPGAGGGGGEEGSNFVLVEQLAARGELTPGFDTGTFGNPYQDPYEYYGEARAGNPEFIFDSGELLINLFEGGLQLRDMFGDKEGLGTWGSGRDPFTGGTEFSDGAGGTRPIMEADLPTEAAGTFQVTAGTGGNALASLVINDEEVINASAANPVRIPAGGFDSIGEFWITGVSVGPNGNYVFEYKVVLNDAWANTLAEQDISVDFVLNMTATNVAGNSSTATGTVKVFDDNPHAEADFRTITETGQSDTWISGNVVDGGNQGKGSAVTGNTGTDTADTPGADGLAANNPVNWNTQGVTTDNTPTNDGSKNLQPNDPAFKTDFSLTGDGPRYTVMDGDKTVGILTLNTDGSYYFEIDPSYEFEHGNHTINIPYTITDRDGDSANAELHITLENVNDTPLLNVYPGAVKEVGVWADGERTNTLNPAENETTTPGGVGDGQHQLSVSGQLTATDEDNDQLTFSLTGDKDGNGIMYVMAEGTMSDTTPAVGVDYLGTITLDSDTGEWTFDLNPDSKTVDQLAEGEDLTVNIPVAVTDNSGTSNDTATDTLPITIHGTNDAPVITNMAGSITNDTTGNLTITESANNTANTSVSGQVTATDIDAGAELTYGFELKGKVVTTLYVDASGNLVDKAPADGNYYGKLTIDQNGQYTFELNNKAECVQKMNDSDTVTISKVPVVVQDEHGAYDEDNFDVTIKGVNDSPYITGGNKGTVKEDGVYAKGDRGADQYLHDGEYGTNGKLDENTPVKDGGTNSDQHKDTFDGKLTAADVDDDVSGLTFAVKSDTVEGTGVGQWEAAEFPGTTGDCTVIHGKYGDLYLKSDGTYKYVLDDTRDATQALREGDAPKESFPVQVSDGHATNGIGTGTIEITVKGTNDAPVFGQGDHNYILAEDGGNYVQTGKVTATDVDGGETAQLHYSFEASDGSVVQTLYAIPDGNGGIAYSTTAPADGNYYGRFTINKTTGDYKFEMNNNAACVQGLGQGDAAKITVPVVVQDPKGAYDKTDLGVTIEGSDDPASINMSALNASQTVIEAGVKPGGNEPYAGQREANGTLHATDPDGNDTLTYKVQDKDGTLHTLGDTSDPAYDSGSKTWTIETEHGTVVFTASQNPDYKGGYDYTYTLNNADPAVNALDREKSFSDGFEVKVESTHTDGQTDSVDANVNITIVGTNDRPEIESNVITVNKNDPDNALDGSFAGKILVTDVDTGHIGNTPGEQQAGGTYNLVVTGKDGASFVEVFADGMPVGVASINPDGSYTIELNAEGKALLEAKAEGEYLEVTTPIRVTDPDGAWSETEVTWQLEGKDDAPRLGNPSDSMVEDGWKAGRPVVLDPNTGNLILNPDYVKDDHVDSISGALAVTAVDKTDAGAGQFTYSLTGDTNGDGVLYVMPNGSGGCTLSDTPPGAGADYIGKMTLNPNGQWEFELNQDSDAVNKMKPGEKLDVTIPTHVEDGRGYDADGSIKITINGTNDRPEITKADGLKSGVDADADGIDDNALMLVNKGQDDPDSYVVKGTATASDPDNEVYNNSGNLGGSTGNAAVSAITFCFIDPDTGQPTQSLQLDHGTVTIDAKTGEYTYTYNVFDENNYKEPNGDGSESYPTQEEFAVYARDNNGAYSEPTNVVVGIDAHDKWDSGQGGPSGPLDVNGDPIVLYEDNKDIHGKGDASVHGGDGQITGGGGYHFIDGAGNKVQSIPALDTEGNKIGTFVIDPVTGKYELIVDNGSDRVQELNDGETITLEPPFVHDFYGNGPVQLPPASVVGTNDVPEFDQDVYKHTLSETEPQDGGDSVSGQIHATDLDEGGAFGDNLTYGAGTPGTGQTVAPDTGFTTIHGKYGDLVLQEDGSYKYTVRDGENIPHDAADEVFNVIVTDEAGATDTAQIIIDLNGLNTPPVYTGDPLDTLGVKEDTGADADGYITDKGSIDKGKFTDADGDVVKLSVAADKNSDGHADDPGAPYAVGKYGTLFLNADGSYEYRLNNHMDAVQGLKEGESLTDNFVIIADDGHGGKVEIKLPVEIKGTNDNPVLSLNDPTGSRYGAGVSLDMVEGQAAAVGGKAVATDVDTNDNYFKYSFKDTDGTFKNTVDAYAEINGQQVKVGEFKIDQATGKYQFVPNDNLAQLKAGQQISVKGEVVVESSSVDGTFDSSDPSYGGSTSGQVTVNITGTNDAPTLEMDSGKVEMTEDSGVYTKSGQLTATDPDADPGDKVTYSVKSGGDVSQTGPTTWVGKYGTLTLNPDGSYTYTLDNDKVQSLAEGEKAHDNFDILAKDKYGATSDTADGISVEITGTNDDPVLTVAAADVPQEGSVTGDFAGTDVDTLDSLKYSVKDAVADTSENDFTHRVDGDHGTLYYNEDSGAYKYVADASTNALGQGETASEKFEVTVTDDHGASDTKDLDVTINGTNEAPTLEAATMALALLASVDSVSGNITFADVDANDSLTLSVDGEAITADNTVVHGEYGDLTVNQDGSYTYVLNHSQETLDALAHSDDGLTDTFKTLVHDQHHAASGESSLTIDITHAGEIDNTYLGTKVDDILTADDTHHQLFGGAGNDTLIGSSGNDILVGGDGDDTLIGGAGDNILTGGHGHDTFVFNTDSLSGHDTITDFTLGQLTGAGENHDADILDISAILDNFTGNDANDLFSGGYLSFGDVQDNGDGNYSVVLKVDANGNGDSYQDLATIHLTNFDPRGAQDMTTELIQQLVYNDQIKF